MNSLPNWLVNRPVAHRGLHNLATGLPESSLSAFEAAATAGYPCELDVQLTDGGELVVVHDFNVQRVTGESKPTAQLTPGDRARLRLFGTSERIPTFAEVLWQVGGRVPLLIELKRARLSLTNDLVDSVVAALERYRGPYALESFDPLIVCAIRASRPKAPVGQVSGRLRSAGMIGRWLGRAMLTNFLTRPDFIAFELDGLPSRIVSWWRARGVAVLAWPVESVEQERWARRHADNVVFSGYLPFSTPHEEDPIS